MAESSETKKHLRASSFLNVWDTFNVFMSTQIKQSLSKLSFLYVKL